jgi:hypothetical protein
MVGYKGGVSLIHTNVHLDEVQRAAMQDSSFTLQHAL